MPTTVQLRTRLLKKLKELFQLDQPDLDFGFYKIMHAKAEQVERFIDNDLLKMVEEAFADASAEKTESEVEAAKRKLIEAMGEDVFDVNGEINEDAAKYPAGKTYTAALQKADGQVASLTEEGQVYDHLFRFFERYYDNGDFVSRRYYTRETDDRAAPFAVPYNGEEVKLHWANADQYYIKTAEYFNNYTFDLTQAAEFRAMNALERTAAGVPDTPVKVHFKIVDASEGEHGNVKVKDDEKRFFIIHEDEPIAFDENGELVVHFQYRADPEKGSKQEGSWRDFRNSEAVEVIRQALQAIQGENATAATCLQLFQAPAPTEKNKSRPLLAKYLNQYTARNTMDYFIHKNLGGFLRRELDFYIKNEVMRLDDLDQADAPAVESYLAKLKVLRKIAHKLIDFLAQLEDFQKKLWLKKKFVVETNYCITLDRVPEALYEEIAANDAQRKEWVKLFAIDEIEATEGDLAEAGKPGYSEPLTLEFLKANDKLVLDTKFFDAGFKARLLEAIEDFDAQCDGLMVHSENFQALRLLGTLFSEQGDCFYVDPPYNTGSDGFSYKDSYQHSSWYSMILNSLLEGKELLSSSGIFSATIDDNEVSGLLALLKEIFGENSLAACAPWRSEPSGGKEKTGLRSGHEYLAIFHNGDSKAISSDERSTGALNLSDKWGKYRKGRELRKWGGTSLREDRPGQFYELKTPSGEISLPIRNDGREGHWRWGKNNPGIKAAQEDPEFFHWEKTPYDVRVIVDGKSERWTPYEKIRDVKKSVGWATWLDSFGINADGTRRLKDLFGEKPFETPKPVALLEWFLNLHSSSEAICIDTFAGSGALGDAVVSLNRADSGKRRYLLAEIADYFDGVLLPRLTKAIYSDNWTSGKPTSRDTGISHCFKYIRLESYEDTLNNLTFEPDPKRTETIDSNPALKEDFMLRYLLDVETRGSQSLLNIDAFADPTAYQLSVKKPGSDEQESRSVDLIETFNYLLGLRVTHYAAPQSFSASFKRTPDPELPDDQHTKLMIDGNLQQIKENHRFTQIDTDKAKKNLCSSVSICGSDKVWWFRKIEGWIPKNPSVPDHETREKNPQNMERILIVWRKLTGDLEQDNLMLDTWFRKHGISTQDYEFDTIYVNGSNNLPNLKQDDEHWKVRLIEEDFMKRMWETSDA